MNKLSENITPNQVDLSSFNLKTELNSKFWKNNKLDSVVRLSLLALAYEFIEDAKIPYVHDIIMTGSLANYNWNEQYSDIDLHIVVDFNDLSNDPEVAKAYCDEKKYNWNTAHENIKMLGYPVELYVQDTHEPHKSTGVYSVLNDKWLTEPSLDKLPNTSNKEHIQDGVAAYCNCIDALIDTFEDVKHSKSHVKAVLNIADKIFDCIKQERKESMAKAEYAELTTGNLLFKTMRRNGYIEKLVQLRRDCFDVLFSL